MKAILYPLLTGLLLAACHHRDRATEHRYGERPPEYRQADDTRHTERSSRQRRGRREEQQHTDNLRTLPYLPPFTMRWNCPPEPQMLGYASR